MSKCKKKKNLNTDKFSCTMNWKIEQKNRVIVREKQKQKLVFWDEMQRLHFRRR